MRKLMAFLVLVMATAVAIPLTLTQPQGGLTPRAYLPVMMTDCDDYFDYFDDPNSGWAVVDDDLVTLQYVNSEYRIFSKQAGYLFRPLAPFPGRDNYVVEVDVRFNAPPMDGLYGLVFGGVTQGLEVIQYYLFAIEPGVQEFRLLRRETSGAFTTLVDSTPSAAIHPSTESNHLTAVRNGDQMTLAVNGTTLGTWTDSVITGPTYTGLALSPHSDSPQADARFDNFRTHICVPGGGGRMAATFQQAAPVTVYDSFDLE
jgi:hypothetical protein